jgi:hypothetical protein
MISNAPTRIKLTLNDLDELDAVRKTWTLKQNGQTQKVSASQQAQEEEDRRRKEVHKRIGLTK